MAFIRRQTTPHSYLSRQGEFEGISNDVEYDFLGQTETFGSTSHISRSTQTTSSFPSVTTSNFTPPFSMALRNRLAKSVVYLCNLVSLKAADIFPASRRDMSSREFTSLSNRRAFRRTKDSRLR